MNDITDAIQWIAGFIGVTCLIALITLCAFLDDEPEDYDHE